MKRRNNHSWIKDRVKEFYFQKAKKEGFKARSAYKLIQIDEKFNVIPTTGKILDLGCSPGAWLQVIQKKSKADIYGIDLINCDISNINFLKTDVKSDEAKTFLKNLEFDSILCDIASNTTGDKSADHYKLIQLLSFISDEIVIPSLKANGIFVCKIFDGPDLNLFIKQMKMHYKKVKQFKPASSMLESCEKYLIIFK